MPNPELKQITIKSDIVPVVENLAREEERSFANMIVVLTREALAARDFAAEEQEAE